jgi:plastocyanin
MRKILLITLFVGVAFAARAADTTVTQSHTSFDVDSATLKAGDSIIFSNKDDVTHNIQVVNSDGDADDKGLQKPGQDIKATFAKAGEYKVRCAIHPKMKMTVTVQ